MAFFPSTFCMVMHGCVSTGQEMDSNMILLPISEADVSTSFLSDLECVRTTYRRCKDKSAK